MSYGEYLKSMGRIADILRGSTDWADVIIKQTNFVNSFKEKLVSSNEMHSESLLQSGKLICNNPALQELERTEALISKTMLSQMELLSEIMSSVYTPQLAELQKSIQMANPVAGMEVFLKSISVSFTAAANIVFLKSIYPDVCDLQNFPSGTFSFLKKIKKRTSGRLSMDDTIEVSLDSKEFRSAENVDARVDLKTMNVIASSTEMFSELRECDLMDFISFLAATPERALKHPVGIKIDEIIQNWNAFMDFDKDTYYHARVKKENGFFHTADEMGSVPNILAEAGRYNHKNQSHYYFADTYEGAREEVRKHSPKSEIQVARLMPKKPVKLVDFSDRTTPYNSFLQLIRCPVADKNKPTEYLLPEYVTTCCKATEIEGIKYYGGLKYNNYVTWTDGYFDVELIFSEIE